MDKELGKRYREGVTAPKDLSLEGEVISKNPKIGFIGFGEVAYYFSKGLKEDGIRQIVSYDKAVAEPIYGEVIRNRAQDADVKLMSTLKELATRSELVISAVWGNVALEVAKEAAPFLGPGKLFVDLNNTAPAAKERGAEVLHAKGAKFVDMAVFASPARMRHRAFSYVSGDGAEEFRAVMSKYGMDIEVVAGEAGKATTIKTLVNIYYKGIQALYLELGMSAFKAGIDLDILEPLLVKPVETLPREREMAYWIVRGGIHAERKAAELQDILEAMKEWGVEPTMIEATINRLNIIAQYKLKDYFKAELSLEDYQAVFETIDKIDEERKIRLK